MLFSGNPPPSSSSQAFSMSQCIHPNIAWASGYQTITSKPKTPSSLSGDVWVYFWARGLSWPHLSQISTLKTSRCWSPDPRMSNSQHHWSGNLPAGNKRRKHSKFWAWFFTASMSKQILWSSGWGQSMQTGLKPRVCTQFKFSPKPKAHQNHQTYHYGFLIIKINPQVNKCLW